LFFGGTRLCFLGVFRPAIAYADASYEQQQQESVW